METIVQILARELGRKTEHIENVIRLIDEGNTIPFIARYRKEMHGTMDDTLLRNLEEVHIVRQGYLDVSSIAELPRLYTVEIKHSRISSVQPIAHLARLRYAGLFDCGVTDVTALENCPWLETLDIGHNDLKELRQVGFHPSLRSVNFMWLNMKNVDDIAQRLPKLRTVYLQHSDIRDLSGLKALPELEAVYVLKEQLDTVSGLFAGTDVEIQVTENWKKHKSFQGGQPAHLSLSKKVAISGLFWYNRSR